MPIEVKRFELGPFATNGYVLRDEAAGDRSCWVVDCPYEPAEMIEWMRGAGLTPSKMLLTHAHCDHIGGLHEFRRVFGRVPVLLHPAEHAWLDDPMLNLSAMLGEPVSVGTPDGELVSGTELRLGGHTFEVRHTPGHSPGGVALVCAGEGLAMVGDTLFAGSVGRSDFPGSDGLTLLRSIREHILTLRDDMTIYPGHGPATTVARERASNPFLRTRE